MDFISIKFIFAVIIFGLFLAYWIFNFTILYHLTRFGVGTKPKKFAAVFLLGSIILFSICVLLLGNININNLIS